MRGLRGFVAGLLGLTLLEVVLRNQAANSRVGGLVSGVATGLSWWLDPRKPLIPDLHPKTPTHIVVANVAQVPSFGRRLPAPVSTPLAGGVTA